MRTVRNSCGMDVNHSQVVTSAEFVEMYHQTFLVGPLQGGRISTNIPLAKSPKEETVPAHLCRAGRYVAAPLGGRI
jgi:hypothetical protein